MSKLPLEGIQVADFSRVLAGPYCSMMLADLGADVIKVEHPKGDETRSWGPPFVSGESAYFLSVNRNKRSITLDLKNETDLKKAHNLIRESDVLLHNFKVGDSKKLQLDIDTVKTLNPTIIYAHISAYGSTGPDASKPGYDLLAQAITGFMSITGEANGQATKVGVAIIDVLAGLNTALGILASLYAQQTQGLRAREVESSLLEAGLASLVNVASNYLVTGETPKRYGNAHASIVPYQAFETADAPLVIAAANNKQFAALARVLGKEAWLKDERFQDNPNRVENRDVIVSDIQNILNTKSRAHWLELLANAGVPAAPVNTLSEVFESEQVRVRQMVLSNKSLLYKDTPLVAAGFKLDGQATALYRHPPALGEHKDELEERLKGKDEDF